MACLFVVFHHFLHSGVRIDTHAAEFIDLEGLHGFSGSVAFGRQEQDLE